MFPIKLISIRGFISTIWLLKIKNSNTFEGIELRIYPEKSITEYKATIGLIGIRKLVYNDDFDLYIYDKQVTFEEFKEIIEKEVQ